MVLFKVNMHVITIVHALFLFFAAFVFSVLLILGFLFSHAFL